MPQLKPAWIDRDDTAGINGTSLEAMNFNRVHPSVNALHKQFIVASAQRRGFIFKEETAIKLIINGKHIVCFNSEDIALDARDLLDYDQELLPGRDYYIYACYNDSDPLNPGMDLVVSLNSTYPQ